MSALFVSAEQRKLLTKPRLLIIDLELTCGPGVSHDIQDIIEVGSCVLALESAPLKEASLSHYIRPERSPVTKFCTQLTGITWEQVANRPNFARTAPRLRELACDAGVDTWVSWGQDQTLLHRQSLAAGVENPFGHLEHVDVKRLLTPLVLNLTGGTKPKGAGSGIGLETAMKELGLRFEGRAHSGAVDAWNTARLVAEVRRLVEPHLKAAAGCDVARRPAHRMRP